MWSSDDVDVHLRPLIERAAGAPDRLVDLQEVAAKEGARFVLARLRSCYPEVSAHVVATSVPENHLLANFSEQVDGTVVMAVMDCELDVSLKK